MNSTQDFECFFRLNYLDYKAKGAIILWLVSDYGLYLECQLSEGNRLDIREKQRCVKPICCKMQRLNNYLEKSVSVSGWILCF